MISVTGFYDAVEEPSTDYDEYTPLTVTWPHHLRSLDSPVSFGLAGEGGYLELKFNPGSGELGELVLVSAVARVHHERIMESVFSSGVPVPVVKLPAGRDGNRNYSDNLPLPQIAHDDGLEIRLSDKTPTEITSGATASFGTLANGELATIYIRWSASNRELYIKSCRLLD